jgi:hypothetical protein
MRRRFDRRVLRRLVSCNPSRMPSPRSLDAIAASIEARFRVLPGSDYIASVFTISGLVHAMARSRPQRMLEVGAGIGTLTYAASAVARELYGDQSDQFVLYAIEDHDGCREALVKNLQDFAGRYTLLRNTAELPHNAAPFDLLCIDGRQLDQLPPMNPRAIIYIEGDRREQREMVTGYLAQRSYSVANYRPLDRRKGYWLFQLDATRREQLTMSARRVFEQSGHAAGRLARRVVGDAAVKRIYARMHAAERWLVRRR